jgi:hypothetical protein
LPETKRRAVSTSASGESTLIDRRHERSDADGEGLGDGLFLGSGLAGRVDEVEDDVGVGEGLVGDAAKAEVELLLRDMVSGRIEERRAGPRFY